jgi:hypothetical protein
MVNKSRRRDGTVTWNLGITRRACPEASKISAKDLRIKDLKGCLFMIRNIAAASPRYPQHNSGTVQSPRQSPFCRAMTVGPQHFSFTVAVLFTLNYIMGTGFLTIPWAFNQSGILLGYVSCIHFISPNLSSTPNSCSLSLCLSLSLSVSLSVSLSLCLSPSVGSLFLG